MPEEPAPQTHLSETAPTEAPTLPTPAATATALLVERFGVALSDIQLSALEQRVQVAATLCERIRSYALQNGDAPAWTFVPPPLDDREVR